MYYVQSHCSFHSILYLKFQIVYPDCLLGISPLLCNRHLKHKMVPKQSLEFSTPKFILLGVLYLSK